MNRKDLVSVLELLKPALASSNVIPILQCFCFGGETTYAYDETIAIVAPLQLDVGGAFALHGQTLLGLLNNSTAEEVTFSQKRDEITMTLGKSVSKLPYQGVDTWLFEEPTDGWAHKVDFTASLADGLELCLKTVSRDTTQPALLGVSLTSNKLYACDGDSLTRVTIPQNIGTDSRVLLSTPFCQAALRLWKELGVTRGELCISDKWAMLDFEDWRVYGNILKIDNPIDFEELIRPHVSSTNKTRGAVTVPDELEKALSRARVLADPESQKTSLTVSKGTLSLLTETHMGTVRDTVQLDHPDVVANVNASHLQQGLHCTEILFGRDCTVLSKGDDVLMLISNMN